MRKISSKFLLWAFVPLLAVQSSLLYGSESGDFHRFWPDNLFAVEFVDEQTGYIAGEKGTLIKTSDAGATWQAYYIGRPELVRRMAVVSGDELWAVGHRGTIFHSADGGESWAVQYENDGIYLRDIAFINADIGWAVGHNALILYTEDGGVHWHEQHLTGYTGRDLPRLHAIEIIDEYRAVLAGEFGVIAHTENSGEQWVITPNQSTVTWLGMAQAEGCLYVVGLDGNAVCLTVASAEERQEIDRAVAEDFMREQNKLKAKAERRGKTYEPIGLETIPRGELEYVINQIDTGTKEHIFDVAVSGDGQVLAVGNSTVLRLADTTSGVSELTAVKLPIEYNWIGGLDFSSGAHFWAAGNKGLVISGDMSSMSYSPALSLSVSSNIELVTSRWTNKNGR